MIQFYPAFLRKNTRSSFRFSHGTCRTAASAIFLLFSGLISQSQITPVNGTTTFNSISNGSYIEYAYTSNGTGGFMASNVQSSGWDISGYTSEADDFVIAGENWGASSDGGFVYLSLVNGHAAVTSMQFKANDGKFFDLNAVDLGYDVTGVNIGFTITGFRSGVAVPGANFSVPVFASFGNGGSWSSGINLSANENFKGIDEFRITPNTADVVGTLDVDNINATNFRTASFAQIIPADIPASNEGAFTKDISGHSFTFTPASNNYVSYLNDVGTEGFGGLYAYDYNTMDGTEETISSPAGYTFDLSSFQYISDRGSVGLTLTLNFANNSTDTKSYTLNGNSSVHTFSGFTTQANDIKSIRIVSDALIYYNNLEVTDIKSMGTLPLRWLEFTGVAQGQSAVLNWRTASEQGTKDFLVQHSTDGRQWQSIGTVMAANATEGEQAYSFVHGNPAKGMNAYRLQQRDADGRSSYSTVVTIIMNTPYELVSVYPNPVVNGKVQVKLQAPAIARVYNTAGVLVIQKQLPAGVSTIELDRFAKGMYTLKVKDYSVLLLVQ